MSLVSGKENSRLHDAIYTLFSALFVHLPFMISAGHLDKVLLLSFKSADADIEESSDESRQESLRLMARKVDVSATLGAVDRNWQRAVETGPIAVNEILEVVTIAVEKHPKSVIAKNIGILTKILFKAFDLRREQTALGDKAIFESTAIDEAESALNDVTIKMIYKLNDSTFRPIFLRFVEWATTGAPKKDEQAQVSRLTTFYKFLEVFFGTLQVSSIHHNLSLQCLTYLVHRYRILQLRVGERRQRPEYHRSLKDPKVSLAGSPPHAPQILRA